MHHMDESPPLLEESEWGDEPGLRVSDAPENCENVMFRRRRSPFGPPFASP